MTRPVGTTTTTDEPLTDRVAVAVFVVACIAAAPLLFWAGSDRWFYLDEWTFITERSLGDPMSLLEGHNGHWVTGPAIVWRVLFSVFGLQTYAPYQIAVVISHIAVAVLVRFTAMRLGARAWVSTAVALTFLLFGSGSTNMVFGFQITLNGSVGLGLTQLLIADHDGDDRRRDLIAVAIGIVGLTTSAVMVPMIVGVGFAVLVRRGLRPALYQTVPPAAVFLCWMTMIGRDSDTTEFQGLWATTEFALRMTASVFEQLGQGAWTGTAIAAIALYGLYDATARAFRNGDGRFIAVAGGLAISWLLFTFLTAVNRTGILTFQPEAPAAGRYTHVGAALVLPIVALGVERLGRNRHVVVALALLPLAFGLPGNVADLSEDLAITDRRDITLAVAYSPLIDQVPAEQLPIRVGLSTFPVTAGWLREAAAAGDLPPIPDISPRTVLTANGILALEPVAASPPDPPCPLVDAPIETVPLSSLAGVTIDVLAGPIEVEFSRANGAPVRICPPDG